MYFCREGFIKIALNKLSQGRALLYSIASSLFDILYSASLNKLCDLWWCISSISSFITFKIHPSTLMSDWMWLLHHCNCSYQLSRQAGIKYSSFSPFGPGYEEAQTTTGSHRGLTPTGSHQTTVWEQWRVNRDLPFAPIERFVLSV